MSKEEIRFLLIGIILGLLVMEGRELYYEWVNRRWRKDRIEKKKIEGNE